MKRERLDVSDERDHEIEEKLFGLKNEFNLG
jgi:hypothetical protein